MCTPRRTSVPRPLVELLPVLWPKTSCRTLGTAKRGGQDDDAGDDREDQPAPAPREHGREHDPGDERGEARLRVREVEPGPDRGDRGRRAEQPRAGRASKSTTTSSGEDRDDEEAPVDGRVPEDRVDPVERRVGVRDDQLRVPEDVARLVLVDRRSPRTTSAIAVSSTSRPSAISAAPGKPRERRSRAARTGARRRAGRSRPVARPASRAIESPAPGDERRERPGERARARARGRRRWSSSQPSSSAAAATTAYSGTSRFASVEPTWTWMRAATQASAANGEHERPAAERRSAPTAASSSPTTAAPPSSGRCPCGAR